MKTISHNFFKLKEDFHIYKKGDVVIIRPMSHNDLVLVASPTRKTEYHTLYRSTVEYKDWYRNAIRKNLLEKCQQLELWELRKIFPHLTKRVKDLDGYHALAQYLPDYLCKHCRDNLTLQVRDGWENSFKFDAYCNGCQKVMGGRIYFRNALKPMDS